MLVSVASCGLQAGWVGGELLFLHWDFELVSFRVRVGVRVKVRVSIRVRFRARNRQTSHENFDAPKHSGNSETEMPI